MIRYIVPYFAFFAILVSASPSPCLDVSTALSSRGFISVSRMEGFSEKLQGAHALELAILWEFSSFSLSTQVGVHGVEASNLKGGWGYRGSEGMQVRLLFDLPVYSFPSSAAYEHRATEKPKDGSTIKIGAGAGVSGYFSRYTFTDQYFFFPAAEGFTYLEVPTLNRRIRFRYTLPLEWGFRRDLTYTFSTGFGLSFLYRLTGGVHE
ncbi:MAG: hypothetical protein SNJ78_10370 [Spirochaetales bacterium]